MSPTEQPGRRPHPPSAGMRAYHECRRLAREAGPVPKDQDPREMARRALFFRARQAGVEEAERHAMQLRITGKKSTRDMTASEMRTVASAIRIAHSRRVRRNALAENSHAGKLRALWISAHHLGVVRDPSENALGAWVRREADVDAAAWASDVRVSGACVEKLKAWLARPEHTGGAAVLWHRGWNPRLCVIRAQAVILQHARDENINGTARAILKQLGDSTDSDRDLDEVIRTLGVHVRRERHGRRAH